MTTLPKLIATDLDHTLLNSEGHVSQRTREALDAARAAGITVVPVTARQPIGLVDIAREAGFEEWALCSNGAFGIHLQTRELLFANEIPAETVAEIVKEIRARVPSVALAVVRDAGEGFIAQPEYAALADFSDHKRKPADMETGSIATITSAPALKLVLRDAQLAVDEIFDEIADLDLPNCELTLSGAPFVDVMAAGITKAAGLAQLCAHLGIGQHEVYAFGDELNDAEMIAWAGHGVAMGNAIDAVKVVADEITGTNDEDGLAQVVERLLAR